MFFCFSPRRNISDSQKTALKMWSHRFRRGVLVKPTLDHYLSGTRPDNRLACALPVAHQPGMLCVLVLAEWR